jgi:hypothetical protein
MAGDAFDNVSSAELGSQVRDLWPAPAPDRARDASVARLDTALRARTHHPALFLSWQDD